MKRILSLILLGTVLLSISSCKDDKKSDNIITSKPEKEVIPTDTLAMTTIAPEARTVTWGEGSYTISVKRYADESLPIAIDESGRKYFDNKIDLKISRADGSVFMDKTFQKTDFNRFLDKNTKENGALLGLPFVEVDGNNLVFSASVGSPNEMSDEFVPIKVKISRMGDIHIELDNDLDTTNDNAAPNPQTNEDDGV
ncbi:MAG: DUF4738 domain-containing protein [Prevotella sp.]|nr:DUF4738 domain-containing protein [Prevotella sp.]